MATEYTIGELAKAADVPSSTLRYYERRGLVEPDNRSEGNYRLYGPETLERVRFTYEDGLAFVAIDENSPPKTDALVNAVAKAGFDATVLK
jgi:hypothetical protein